MQRTYALVEKRKRATGVAAAVFLTPAILILIVFIGYPIANSFYTSFFSWNGITAGKVFIGMKNWTELLADATFWKAFRNNIVVVILSLVIQMPIGMAIATWLDRKGKKGNLFKVIWFLPMLMSSVAVGYLFKYALDANTGIITSISKFFGGKNIDLLGNPGFVLVTVVIVICWQFIPFYMVYYLAAYSGLSEDIHEAAKIDGATESQYFWRVALPMMKPAIKSAVVLSIVGSLKYFDLIYVMTGGGPGTASELMATYMYSNAFESYKMGYASAIASGMFLLITAISLITMRAINGKEE